MNRLSSLFMICCSLTLMLLMGSVNAMPLTSAAKDLRNATMSTDAIQKVHGCHHYCARGPAGWHRHGPLCGRWRC
jgi:hypothetical protein